MKILLFGGNGQVGASLQPILSKMGSLIVATRKDVDFTDTERLGRFVRAASPDLVVNAAAYTAVDRAEVEPELAHQVNSLAPEVLAQETERLGATLVHYSTDYVFDGSGIDPWREADAPNPLSIYGKTKLEGEMRVLDATSRAYILRTSWVYSAHGHNFLKTILRAARSQDVLEVVNDQIGAPTGSELIASVTKNIIDRRADMAAGVYHLAASGFVSWFDYATHLIGAARQTAGANLQVREVTPTKTANRPSAAPRPLNSRLDTSKLSAALGISLPPWQEGVDQLVAKVIGDELL